MTDFNADESNSPPAGGDPNGATNEDLTTHVPPRGGDGWHEGFDFDAPPAS